jgi:hypothetical protein
MIQVDCENGKHRKYCAYYQPDNKVFIGFISRCHKDLMIKSSKLLPVKRHSAATKTIRSSNEELAQLNNQVAPNG